LEFVSKGTDRRGKCRGFDAQFVGIQKKRGHADGGCRPTVGYLLSLMLNLKDDNGRIAGSEISSKVLMTKAKEVPAITVAEKQLVKDMIETMYEEKGVGLRPIRWVY